MVKKFEQEKPVSYGSDLDFDLPLQPATALAHDRLGREGFAAIAASALGKVSSSAGFVLSIEGPWGSGKSSTLAMIQALLDKEEPNAAPVIVHFNPWPCWNARWRSVLQTVKPVPLTLLMKAQLASAAQTSGFG